MHIQLHYVEFWLPLYTDSSPLNKWQYKQRCWTILTSTGCRAMSWKRPWGRTTRPRIFPNRVRITRSLCFQSAKSRSSRARLLLTRPAKRKTYNARTAPFSPQNGRHFCRAIRPTRWRSAESELVSNSHSSPPLLNLSSLNSSQNLRTLPRKESRQWDKQ